MKDAFGSEYATVGSLSKGLKVRVDDGFTCMKRWAIKEIQQNEGGFYLPCHEGCHYLDAEARYDANNEVWYYMGIYHVNN